MKHFWKNTDIKDCHYFSTKNRENPFKLSYHKFWSHSKATIFHSRLFLNLYWHFIWKNSKGLHWNFSSSQIVFWFRMRVQIFELQKIWPSFALHTEKLLYFIISYYVGIQSLWRWHCLHQQYRVHYDQLLLISTS